MKPKDTKIIKKVFKQTKDPKAHDDNCWNRWNRSVVIF